MGVSGRLLAEVRGGPDSSAKGGNGYGQDDQGGAEGRKGDHPNVLPAIRLGTNLLLVGNNGVEYPSIQTSGGDRCAFTQA